MILEERERGLRYKVKAHLRFSRVFSQATLRRKLEF